MSALNMFDEREILSMNSFMACYWKSGNYFAMAYKMKHVRKMSGRTFYVSTNV